MRVWVSKGLRPRRHQCWSLCSARSSMQLFTHGDRVLTQIYFADFKLANAITACMSAHLLPRTSSMQKSQRAKVQSSQSEPFLMCLAGSRCLEKLCDSLEVTGEIFTDFHLQSGLFMWLQRLCKDLDSSCCYIRSNRTTMSVEYAHTSPLSANSKWCPPPPP